MDVVNISPVSGPLPSLTELMQDTQLAFKNDQLNSLLNQEPPAAWLRDHPFVKVKDEKGNNVPLKYLPIEKTEFLLIKIFQRYTVEIINSGSIFNSVFVHVRLKLTCPITGLPIVHDGIGATNVQVDSGGSAADLSKIKAAAVQMALPSAKSYAIKDAAEHLGRLFGRDLNRHNVVGVNSYNNLAERWQKPE